ncbi:MAG TPA: NADPH-dependent F420 reductase [Bryobacteraceae bacterium]|nr:NADPH-dependent F420 reductase [Bryobacteraceae bacterium]
MTIGILGSGNVGGTLGTHWARAGHHVIFGSRDPESNELRALAARATRPDGQPSKAGTFREAGQAEVLLVATPWMATRAVLESFDGLIGKVLIDATNPLRPDLSGLEIGTSSSAAEHVAEWAHGGKVVKAFNTVGYNIMADPAFGADRSVMFYCGDDAGAKHTVRPLIEDLGFDAVDAGPLSQARLLEPFALLWISLAYQQGLGREIGFKLLRR